MNSGYSKTPLVKKLGIKEGFKIKLFNIPDYYFNLLEGLPENISIIENNSDMRADFIHYFAKDPADLVKDLEYLQNQIEQNGMIWISWDKTKSKKKDAVNENFVRQCALNLNLVDVKVCAVDETWSGLKLLIRKEKRKS